MKIEEEIWKKIGHYYRLSSKLVHERATVSVSNNEVWVYRETVEFVLTLLFGSLRF